MIVRITALLGLLCGFLQGAVSISGLVGTAFKDSLNVNIPSGSLAMLVVDEFSTGFLSNSQNGAISGSINGLTSASDPKVAVANASITDGGYFGGNKIINLITAGGSGSISGLLPSESISGLTGKNFALIWFYKSAATLASEGLTNQMYGIIRGADWTLPGTDTGTFTMSTTDAVPADNYYSFSTAATLNQIGSGFFTGSGTAANSGSTAVRAATFQIVPEPSAVLLAALGSLGLLRRRRN